MPKPFDIFEVEEKSTTLGEAAKSGALKHYSRVMQRYAEERPEDLFFTYVYRGYIIGTSPLRPATFGEIRAFATSYQNDIGG